MNYDEKKLPSSVRTSTEILYRPTTSISHHRSNTVPARYRKSEKLKSTNQQQTHLSPTYKRNENKIQNNPQFFSPSLLQIQPKRRIHIIDDDTDEGDSPTSSIINRSQ